MANDYMALADLLVINDSNNSDIDVSDLLQDAPFLQQVASVPASNGTLHKYVKTTGAPVVGFRSVNDGREYDSAVRSQVSITLQILDASIMVDKDLAGAYKGGPEALLRLEAMESLKAAFFKMEQQLINGTISGDAAGFEGLADAIPDLAATVNCIGAGGSTALTSVWLVRSGMSDVSAVIGNEGRIDIGETVVQRIAGATTGFFPGYFTPISAYAGFQMASTYSAVRIANVSSTTYTLTDDLIYQALELFPSSRQPTHILMNRRSLEQLRDSRTATNATGTPAPRPADVDGFPIIVTDAIGNAETAIT